MILYRKLAGAAVAAALLSATGIALAGAQAETHEPTVVALPATPATPVAPIPPAPVERAAPVLPAAPAAPPRAPSRATSSDAVDGELACLARVILYEAGNQGRRGQLAVAQVVMNRVDSPRFPDTICGVVLQRGQFSSIRSFHPPRDARWRRALAIARDARAGISAPVVGNALYFHAARIRPAFVRNRVRIAQLGDHIFYR